MKTTTPGKREKAHTALGVFTNQNGSEIDLHEDAFGRVVGEFRLAACCSQHGPRDFSLTGFQTGNAVTFCVSFPERECVTAWVGQFDEDGTLRTTWQMSIDCHTDSKKAWRATWTGVDVFTAGKRAADVKPAESIVAVSHPFYCGLI